MTEEEFFMGFAEMFEVTSFSIGVECFLWVMACLIVGAVAPTAYIALGDAIKSFKRKGSQRAVTPKRKE
jgi:hypothetical protein